MDVIEISALPNDQLRVKVTERVILSGKYQSSPEEAAQVQAGRWALARTDNEAVRRALEEYIQDIIEDVRQSSEAGFEIEFVVRHDLVIANDKDGPQIVQDSFTDRDNVNPFGTDNVSWVAGKYVRSRPALTEMPDYVMNVTPIEQLGAGLLNHFTEICSGQTLSPNFDKYTIDLSATVFYIDCQGADTAHPCRINTRK